MKFILFYLLTLITRNIFLSLFIVLALYFILDRRFIGLLPDLGAPLRARREIGRLKRAVMLNPHNGNALTDLGRLLVRRGKYSEGVEFLERALDKMSDIAETHFYLGLGLLRTNQLDRAGEHLQQAIAIDPKYGYGEPFLRLGDYYMERKEPEPALEAYQKFVRIHSSSSEGFFKIAEIWRLEGDMQKAEQFYHQAMSAMRGSPPHKKRVDRRWFWRARFQLFGLARGRG